MHAVLSNFNQQEPHHTPTVHNLFVSTLQQFRIELLEVTVTRDDEHDCFACELLMFDGEKEVRRTSGFIDGVILAKIFACPIYTNEELMEKYASGFHVKADTTSQEKNLLDTIGSMYNADMEMYGYFAMRPVYLSDIVE
jgi:bifunctional DNase/RNase